MSLMTGAARRANGHALPPLAHDASSTQQQQHGSVTSDAASTAAHARHADSASSNHSVGHDGSDAYSSHNNTTTTAARELGQLKDLLRRQSRQLHEHSSSVLNVYAMRHDDVQTTATAASATTATTAITSGSSHNNSSNSSSSLGSGGSSNSSSGHSKHLLLRRSLPPLHASQDAAATATPAQRHDGDVASHARRHDGASRVTQSQPPPHAARDLGTASDDVDVDRTLVNKRYDDNNNNNDNSSNSNNNDDNSSSNGEQQRRRRVVAVCSGAVYSKTGAVHIGRATLQANDGSSSNSSRSSSHHNNNNEPSADVQRGDAELSRLSDELAQREARMAARVHTLQKQWSASTSSSATAASAVVRKTIVPATPSVLLATSEAEIQERAMAAEEFAKSQSLRRSLSMRGSKSRHGDTDATRHRASDMPRRSASRHRHDDDNDENDTSNSSSSRGDDDDRQSPEPRELSASVLRPGSARDRVALCSSSVARVTDGTIAIMEMLANRADVVLPSPTETSVVRTGDVLSSRHVLKVDLQEALYKRHGSTGMIAGAPYFRIVPKLNIAGVSQANVSAIRTILNELRRAHVAGTVIWVNLRDEPVVYINNAAHVVRERDEPRKPVIIPNATGAVIAAMEAKLKREVLQEALENGGNISVCVERNGSGSASDGDGGDGGDGGHRALEDQWESADAQSVRTSEEVFRHMARSVAASLEVQYYRRPITQNVGPRPADFDFVLDACLEEPKAVFVFNCQTGRGRTSAMMQIANIVRFYQLCVKDVSVDVRLMRGDVDTLTFRTIQKLVSLFPDGKLHERRLTILMDLADKVYSMADHIRDAFASISDGASGGGGGSDGGDGGDADGGGAGGDGGDTVDVAVAAMRLQMYAHFLVFSYYCEQRLWSFATKLSFVQWLDANPDIRLLINSVRDKLDDQLRAERITAPVAHGAEAAVARAVRARHGNVLSTGRILCSMPMRTVAKAAAAATSDGSRRNSISSSKNSRSNSSVAGHASALAGGVAAADAAAAAAALQCQVRQLAPGVPVFTCGRLSKDDRDALLEHIYAAFPRQTKVHWLSLRAEPMIIVNDVNYTLGDYNTPPAATETGMSMHVSLQAIEQMEDRLRRDVLLEAQENGGVIVLHRLTDAGTREAVHVRVRAVRTPRSTMDDFVHEQRGKVRYKRIPIPFSGQMLASDLDPLVRYLYEGGIGPHDILVINDSEGSTRTTVALNIITLYRTACLTDLRTVTHADDIAAALRVDGSADTLVPCAHMASNMPVDADEVPEHPIEVLLASTICQMLTAGTLLRTVDAAIALGGRGRRWNLLHALDYLKSRIAVMGANKPKCIVDALHGLRSYLLVLLSSLYFDEQGAVTVPTDTANNNNYNNTSNDDNDNDNNNNVDDATTAAWSPPVSFSAWIDARASVANIINTLESRGEAALRYVPSDNLMKADLSRRCGEVLTANFCLKADHFPGCQKKGLRPALCGAPNFRKVDLVNVYGVAIPTIVGIHNVLALLGASSAPLRTYPGQSNDAELHLGFAAPRLFDRAFQSAELQRPLRGSVVWVNLREEPILYVGDRPFVFRDLAAPYVNVELTGIQTDKIEHVENQLKVDVLHEADAYGGKFLVHDEGTPGELVGVWEVANAGTVRTLREVYAELQAQGIRCRMLRLPVTDEQSPDIRDFDLLVDALLPRITEHLDRRETLSFVFNCQMGRGRTTTGMVVCCLLIGLVIPEYYDELHSRYHPLYHDDESALCKGEYAVIVQLKRVLTQGRQAKYMVDLVLEACSKMQNLRTAIESFAIAAASPDVTEASRARAHHAGVHYLVRYFNLIVFAVYLSEEFDRIRKCMRRSFVQWMHSHPELTTLVATCALK